MKENQNTEWKESWRDDYLRWVCGFANAEGGTLVIGRNDQGQAVGVANAARLLEEIPNKVRDVLGIMVDVNLLVAGAFVKIGYFETNADLLYQDEVNGPLLVQVNKTIEVLQAKYMKALISYDGLQRVETWPVPLSALREAVLNAVVHKDYTSGAPIQISVYADKLMIWNSGRLSPEWTVARLLGKHASAPFNPDVANAFFRGGQIESWGRGIERMVQACLDAGLQAPVLQLEDGGVWVTFAFAPVKALMGGEKWGEKWGEKATATRLALVQAMRRNPQISTVALAAVLGMASTSGVEKHLKALREAGCIRRAGPAKGGTWEVMEDVL